MLKIWFQNISRAAAQRYHATCSQHDMKPERFFLIRHAGGGRRKTKGAFRHISTGHRRTVFFLNAFDVIVSKMVLAPGCVGQRLHKTSDRNLKCFTAFFYAACHGDSRRSERFPSVRLKGLLPITVN